MSSYNTRTSSKKRLFKDIDDKCLTSDYIDEVILDTEKIQDDSEINNKDIIFEKILQYDDITLSNETNSEQEGTIKFLYCVSRMNPPTPGHLLLVEEMFKIARKEEINTIFIILSETLDEKNPLKCNLIDDSVSKKNVLYRMIDSLKKEKGFEDINHIVECCKSPHICVLPIVNNYYSERIKNEKVKLILVAGSDRCKDYLTAIPSCTFKNDIIASYRLMVLPRKDMESTINIDITDSDNWNNILNNPSAMSGSFVRNIVKKNEFEKFYELYSKYLINDIGEPDRDFISSLYSEISSGMKASILKKKSKSKKVESPPYGACIGPSQFFIKNEKKISAGKKTKKTKKHKKRTYKNKK